MANGAHRASEQERLHTESVWPCRSETFWPRHTHSKVTQSYEQVSSVRVAANWVSMQGRARSENAAEFSSFKVFRQNEERV